MTSISIHSHRCLAVVACVCSIVASAFAEDIVIERLKGSDLVLTPMSDSSIRVRIKGESAHDLENLIYLPVEREVVYDYSDEGNKSVLRLSHISAEYDSETDALTFRDANGKVILMEIEHGRTIVPSTVQDETTTIAGQKFYSPDDESLFGTGQYQDGHLDVRGLSRRLTQVNTQIALPFVLSNKGYGLLWNNYGYSDFNPSTSFVTLIPTDEEGQIITVDVTTTTGNASEERRIDAFTGEIEIHEDGDYSLLLDVGQTMARKHKVTIDDSVYVDVNNLWLPPTTSFIARLDKGRHCVRVEGEKHDKPVISWRKVNNETEWLSPVSAGIDYTVFAGTPDEVIASYRTLTGNVPLPPQWALGYIHCRERYNTQDELLSNALEFRKRNIPIDVIVQDWQYWGKYGWNAMRFDEEKYPDPSAMVDTLHANNIKLMLSVWAKLDVNSELGSIARSKGYLIPGSEWVDFFNPEAAAFYWNNSSERLLQAHGIDAWWQDATEPENDDLHGRRIGNGSLPGEVYRNAFPMFVNRTVYEGLRRDDPSRRVMIMTRSGFPGIQRYAVATWSGDVGWDFPTFRRQIAGGLGQMAAGLPWWTYDAGGFFRPSNQYDNEEYHEVFLRWLQCATFLPLMRVHGYMSNTEPWRYGETVDSIARKYIEMRYALLPYSYTLAAKVANDGYTLTRPLVMDFYDDAEALKQNTQFMFGPSILVAPVTVPKEVATKVYLPAGCDWIDYWTRETLEGGQCVYRTMNIDQLPLFVKAGAILPLSQDRKYASDDTDGGLEIRVYAGADGEFTLYEDEGDNYNYLNGACSYIPFVWDETSRILSIGERKGSFPGMKDTRKFTITTHDGKQETVTYSGFPLTIQL